MTNNELLDAAGVPTVCPPILLPAHVEAVLAITRSQRRQLEAVGWLVPTAKTTGGHARYDKVDLARAILEHGFIPYWDRLDPDDD